MCFRCDYPALLQASGLGVTQNRLKVLEVIGDHDSPLCAQEIFTTLKSRTSINRVTVYRILDLLVAYGLAERISSGGRAFFYGMAPNPHHQPHPHFYCRQCGHMECLNPESLNIDLEHLDRVFPGIVQGVEVRVDGICKSCLKGDAKCNPISPP